MIHRLQFIIGRSQSSKAKECQVCCQWQRPPNASAGSCNHRARPNPRVQPILRRKVRGAKRLTRNVRRLIQVARKAGRDYANTLTPQTLTQLFSKWAYNFGNGSAEAAFV